MPTTLADVLNLFTLTAVGPNSFEGTQPDTPNHHIVGGQIAAQALKAASLTASQRPPHSLHVNFLRLGDSRWPVRFDVTILRDGGTFSTRRVTASQGGDVLMEGIASFTAGIDGSDYQDGRPDAPEPDTLLPVEEQLAPFADELGGWWVQARPFDTRYIDPPPRIGGDTALSRIWLQARGDVPSDQVVNSCLLTFLSALTPLEAALGRMHKSPMDVSALLDHTVWFHRPADFADWLYFEQHSPSGTAGRALATGTIYNRSGALVCTASQEGYFPRPRYG
ncbi:thioesterase family protein [soil metagenome]